MPPPRTALAFFLKKVISLPSRSVFGEFREFLQSSYPKAVAKWENFLNKKFRKDSTDFESGSQKEIFLESLKNRYVKQPDSKNTDSFWDIFHPMMTRLDGKGVADLFIAYDFLSSVSNKSLFSGWVHRCFKGGVLSSPDPTPVPFDGVKTNRIRAKDGEDYRVLLFKEPPENPAARRYFDWSLVRIFNDSFGNGKTNTAVWESGDAKKLDFMLGVFNRYASSGSCYMVYHEKSNDPVALYSAQEITIETNGKKAKAPYIACQFTRSIFEGKGIGKYLRLRQFADYVPAERGFFDGQPLFFTTSNPKLIRDLGSSRYGYSPTLYPRVFAKIESFQKLFVSWLDSQDRQEKEAFQKSGIIVASDDSKECSVNFRFLVQPELMNMPDYSSVSAWTNRWMELNKIEDPALCKVLNSASAQVALGQLKLLFKSAFAYATDQEQALQETVYQLASQTVSKREKLGQDFGTWFPAFRKWVPIKDELPTNSFAEKIFFQSIREDGIFIAMTAVYPAGMLRREWARQQGREIGSDGRTLAESNECHCCCVQ